MPMPHRTQQQVIKRRLVGKEGSERIRELRAILADLPGYRNGPYADLRKWVEGELTAARTRKKVVAERAGTVTLLVVNMPKEDHWVAGSEGATRSSNGAVPPVQRKKRFVFVR